MYGVQKDFDRLPASRALSEGHGPAVFNKQVKLTTEEWKLAAQKTSLTYDEWLERFGQPFVEQGKSKTVGPPSLGMLEEPHAPQTVGVAQRPADSSGAVPPPQLLRSASSVGAPAASPSKQCFLSASSLYPISEDSARVVSSLRSSPNKLHGSVAAGVSDDEVSLAGTVTSQSHASQSLGVVTNKLEFLEVLA